MLTRCEFAKIAGMGAGALTLSSCGLWPISDQQAPLQSLPSLSNALARTFLLTRQWHRTWTFEGHGAC